MQCIDGPAVVCCCSVLAAVWCYSVLLKRVVAACCCSVLVQCVVAVYFIWQLKIAGAHASLIHMCDMTHSCVSHDSCPSGELVIRDMTQSYAT